MDSTRNMLIIFPADSSFDRVIDPSYKEESDLAQHYGLDVGHINNDHKLAIIEGAKEGGTAIYRGWMMKPDEYTAFYRTVLDRGYRLINSPEEYRYCHEFPQWYPDLDWYTPNSIVIPGPFSELTDWDEIEKKVIDELGLGPQIVKDYVKSAKHSWKEACYIPCVDAISEIAQNFLKIQGDDLNGGLVFREYARLESIGEHAKSGIPLFNEQRGFFLGGNELSMFNYWGPEEVRNEPKKCGLNGPCSVHKSERIPTSTIQGIVSFVKSNFFTADFAAMNSGIDNDWTLIELGDGQVAGLPSHADKRAFYRKLAYRFTFND